MVERKLLGRFQHRYGPNRVGPKGLLQPLADAVKLVSKEAYKPANAQGVLWAVGPLLVVFSGLAALAIMPFGNVKDGVGFYGIDVPIGVLYFFAFGSFGFYGLLLGGWASGSKYSFLGAMRSAAQLISYEISMGLALLGAIMMAGTLSLPAIVEAQDQIWYVIPQFVGFIDLHDRRLRRGQPRAVRPARGRRRARRRLPDRVRRHALRHLRDDRVHRDVRHLRDRRRPSSSAAGTAPARAGSTRSGRSAKIIGVILFFMWIRATLPRLRYDQLMCLGWKVLLPLATLNVLVTAVLVTLT